MEEQKTSGRVQQGRDRQKSALRKNIESNIENLEEKLKKERAKLEKVMIKDFVDKHPEFAKKQVIRFKDGKKTLKGKIHGHRYNDEKIILKVYAYTTYGVVGRIDRRVELYNVVK